MIRLTATCQMQRARPGSPRQPTSESTVPKKQIARRVRDPRICRLVQPPPPPQRHRHDPADRTGSRLLQSNPDSPRGCHPIARASIKPGGNQSSPYRDDGLPQMSHITLTDRVIRPPVDTAYVVSRDCSASAPWYPLWAVPLDRWLRSLVLGSHPCIVDARVR